MITRIFRITRMLLSTCVFVMGMNTIMASNNDVSTSTSKSSSLSYVFDETKYPYFVYSAGMHVCGGTVIWEDVLLTSAHCYGMFIENGVYIGGITADGQYSHEHYNVQVEMKHPLYDNDSSSSENDIMLVKLQSYTNIQPVEIDFNEMNVNTTQLVSIGYGDVSTMGIQLMSIQSNIVSYSQCRKALGVSIDNKNMICTMSTSSIDDNLCLDGPVFDSITGMQIALSSFGKGCGVSTVTTKVVNTSNPIINTRLSYYKKFIQNGLCTLSNSLRKPYYCYDPTVSPTNSPTVAPRNKPPMTGTPWTNYPITSPPITVTPTGRPSLRPISSAPSKVPTSVPTSSTPSAMPTGTIQSDVPSIGNRIRDGTKTQVPTLSMSDMPSMVPSMSPSNTLASDVPSNVPSTILLSDMPSNVPSDMPSNVQSDLPSSVPSDVLSNVPSFMPSIVPSSVPSILPTVLPTTQKKSVKKSKKNKNKRTSNTRCSSVNERCSNNDDCCGDGLMECVVQQKFFVQDVYVHTRTCQQIIRQQVDDDDTSRF